MRWWSLKSRAEKRDADVDLIVAQLKSQEPEEPAIPLGERVRGWFYVGREDGTIIFP